MSACAPARVRGAIVTSAGQCSTARGLASVLIARLARVQLCVPKSCEASRQLPSPRLSRADCSFHAPSGGAGVWARGVSWAPQPPLQEVAAFARTIAELSNAACPHRPRWPTPPAGSTWALVALSAEHSTLSCLTVATCRAHASPALITRPTRIAAPMRIAFLPLCRLAHQLVHGRACSGRGARVSGAGAGGGGNRAGTLLLGAAVASMVGGGAWYMHNQRQGRQTGAPLGVGPRVAESDVLRPAVTGAGHGKDFESSLYRVC